MFSLSRRIAGLAALGFALSLAQASATEGMSDVATPAAATTEIAVAPEPAAALSAEVAAPAASLERADIASASAQMIAPRRRGYILSHPARRIRPQVAQASGCGSWCHRQFVLMVGIGY